MLVGRTDVGLIYYSIGVSQPITRGVEFSPWNLALAESSAGEYSLFTFSVPLFKRTLTGMSPPLSVRLSRRYRNLMLFTAL